MSDKVVAVRSIEIVTAEIHTIRDNVARVFMDGVVQIGRRLEEAKQLVPQGEWLTYLDQQLGYKPSTAQNYMRIAREFGNGQVSLSGKTAQDVFGGLGYSQLLPLLGMPEEEREELAEEHDLTGMSSREIAELVKERDALKKKADRLPAAEKAAELAESKIREIKADLTLAKNESKAATAQKKDAIKEAAELKKQLDELAAKAEQPRELTEEELAEVREKIAAEGAEAIKAAERRAAEAAAKLEKAKNPALHQVNFLFGELQGVYKRLEDALGALEEQDGETAGKLREAIAKVIRGWIE